MIKQNLAMVGLMKYVSLHNRSVTSSQLEFFRMLDEKIEKVFTISYRPRYDLKKKPLKYANLNVFNMFSILEIENSYLPVKATN